MADVLEFPSPTVVAPQSDAAARDQALDIAASFIVEAPAGSGKTGLLIQRFLKLLASPTVQEPADVLAITFTRKATHEMRDRVFQQLAAARSVEKPNNEFDRLTRTLAMDVLARDEALGWGLLAHPARLNISTIDALSIRIAGSLPILTGGTGLKPVERAEDLYADAARRTLQLLGGPDRTLHHALEQLLLHRDGNLAECEHLIAQMLPWRDQWLDLLPAGEAELTDEALDTITLPRMERLLEQAVCRALTHLNQLLPPELCHVLATLARRMAHRPPYGAEVSPLTVCRELAGAPGDAASDLETWQAFAHIAIAPSKKDWRAPRGLQRSHLKFELAPKDKLALEDLITALRRIPGLREALVDLDRLPPLRYPPEQWKIAKALFRVLRRALTDLTDVFAGRGECDFTEFSLLARRALQQDHAAGDLTASNSLSARHLLVDEVQDTSNAQYQLLRLLTADWDGRTRTVFLVGDPKQSIYLFRQARVERFLDTLRHGRLGTLELTPLFLSRNFRSQAELVHGFNRTFTPIFPPDTPDPVLYHPAEPTRHAAPGPGLQWHAETLPAGSDADARNQARTRHAQEIRETMQAWRVRPLPAGRTKPWTIAILVAARSHLAEILPALHSAAIPFRAFDIQPLRERQEILDLVALTRALLHPADRAAWLALLRTPWCGLTLRDLHLLAGADDIQWAGRTVLDAVRERGDLLSSDGIARLQPFWAVLSAALAQRGRMPLSQLVEHTWRAFAAERFASPEELENVDRFLALLDRLEAAGPVTADSLDHALDRLFAAPSQEENAVDILTIHGAKGLEWDVVFVPALERPGQGGDTRLLSWLELENGDADGASKSNSPGPAHGLVAPLSSRGATTHQLTKWMKRVDSLREEAERKRLFYVACTRAREELHLYAAPESTRQGGVSPAPRTLLKAAWPGAASELDTRPRPPEEEPEVIEIAAAAGLHLVEPAPPLIDAARPLVRIPLEAMPGATLARIHAPLKSVAAKLPFHSFRRTEGTAEARAFGNTLHDLLALSADRLSADRLATGTSVESLHTEMRQWLPRIEVLLRTHGLTPAAIATSAPRLQRALIQTLQHEDGRWLLAAHPHAISEPSLESLRPDRIFIAGPEPHKPGQTHLWVVDYKSSSGSRDDLEPFFARERERHTPQLETYATALTPVGLPIRLALYFPLHTRLLWWPHAAEEPPSPMLF